MFAGLIVSRELLYFSLVLKGSQPLKIRARGFFFGASNCKNLSGKSSFERGPGRATVVEPKSREQLGKNAGHFAVLTRQKNSFKVGFYMISELFYCIKNPESSHPSQVSQVPHDKKSRVELTGETTDS